MTRDVTVTLNDDLNDLHELLEVIEDFRALHGIPHKECYHIHLVCEEVFVNFIMHSEVLHSQKKMHINLQLKGQHLTITLRDNGVALNPLDIPKPNINAPLEERNIGGLGVFLVKKWADTIEYKYENKVNTLIIKKTLNFNALEE